MQSRLCSWLNLQTSTEVLDDWSLQTFLTTPATVQTKRKEVLTQHDVGGRVSGVIGGVVGGELLEFADVGEHSAETQRINTQG